MGNVLTYEYADDRYRRKSMNRLHKQYNISAEDVICIDLVRNCEYTYPVQMILKDVLRKKREDAHLSVLELSEILDVSDKTVYAWEAGYRFPSVRYLARVAECFNTTIAEILDEDFLTSQLKLRFGLDFTPSMKYGSRSFKRDRACAIGKRVSYYRKSVLNVTQKELAKMCGIKSSYLCEVETGKLTPSRKLATKLSEVFGVDLSEFEA